MKRPTRKFFKTFFFNSTEPPKIDEISQRTTFGLDSQFNIFLREMLKTVNSSEFSYKYDVLMRIPSFHQKLVNTL